jgi:hypothetical protein
MQEVFLQILALHTKHGSVSMGCQWVVHCVIVNICIQQKKMVETAVLNLYTYMFQL